MLISLVLFLPACDRINNGQTIIEEEVVEVKESGENSQFYLSFIPEQDRDMFTSGVCESKLPSKDNIKKIAMSVVSQTSETGPIIAIYGILDVEEKKIKYYRNLIDGINGEEELLQTIELSDEDFSNIMENFEVNLLVNEIDFDSGFRKIAIEYQDGSCYAYETTIEVYTYGSPESNMVVAFFKYMNLSDDDRMDMLLRYQ